MGMTRNDRVARNIERLHRYDLTEREMMVMERLFRAGMSQACEQEWYSNYDRCWGEGYPTDLQLTRRQFVNTLRGLQKKGLIESFNMEREVEVSYSTTVTFPRHLLIADRNRKGKGDE